MGLERGQEGLDPSPVAHTALWPAELQDWVHPPAMAATASPLPPTTKVASSENSSSFYDYEYYLEDMIFMLCRKDEVLSFGRVFLPVFYSLIFVLGLVGSLHSSVIC